MPPALSVSSSIATGEKGQAVLKYHGKFQESKYTAQSIHVLRIKGNSLKQNGVIYALLPPPPQSPQGVTESSM
jgi:hypothetical protein